MSLIATPWTSPYDAAPEKWNPGSRLRFGCCLPSSGFAVLNCDREEPAFTRDKVAAPAPGPCPTSLSTPPSNRKRYAAPWRIWLSLSGEALLPMTGRTVRTGSRVAGEYSPARCTRDKPGAGEYSSASYLHHYLLSWLGSTPRPTCYNRLGSTPRPPTCITTYSTGWGVLLG